MVEEVGTSTVDDVLVEEAKRGRGRITESDEAALDSPADAGTVTIDGSTIVLDAVLVAEIDTVVVAVAYGIVKTPSPERSVDVDELVG